MSAAGLLDLAKKRFGDSLTDADETLFRKTAIGEVAYYGKGDPADADKWGEGRVLRAERIEWLCIDREAVKKVTHKGVQISGARIEGKVTLSFTKIGFPLLIENSAIPEGMVIQRAHLAALFLIGTHTGPINADGLRVEHDLLMRNGFQAAGEVRLLGAKIGGNLDCGNGHFSNPNGSALKADGIKVEGSVSLKNEFRATGEVRLLNAKIGRNLECDNSRFCNPNGYALDAAGVEVGGGVFLGNEFQATGEVRLLGAKIGGDLSCTNSRFSNPNGRALNADRVEVGGSVFLRNQFHATGEVILLNAKIKTNLECDNSHFCNPNGGNALNAAGVEVKNSVFLREQFQAKGVVVFTAASVARHFQWREVKNPKLCTLRLESARIGTLWDEKESWPAKLYLDGLVYDRLHNKAPLDWTERLKWLRLQDYDKFVPQPYAQLAKVLNDMGHEAVARKILIAKQKDPARLKAMTRAQRAGHHVLGWTIGYGYRPWMAVWWIMGFMLIGTLFFWIGFDNGRFAETKEGTAPTFSAIVYSIDTFVPLVDLHQAKYHLPKAGWLRLYFWIHIGLGWVLTTLLFVGLTGLVRK